ncbi:MAG: hypothetical protein AB7V42_11790 [Thermoleophilia bacterium]
MTGRPDRDDDRTPPDDGLRYPDPGPLRRIQAVTAVLIVGVIVVILLSDKRPAEVRYGTLIGVAVLVVAIAIAIRRKKRTGDAPEGPNAGKSEEIGSHEDG